MVHRSSSSADLSRVPSLGRARVEPARKGGGTIMVSATASGSVVYNNSMCVGLHMYACEDYLLLCTCTCSLAVATVASHVSRFGNVIVISYW